MKEAIKNLAALFLITVSMGGINYLKDSYHRTKINDELRKEVTRKCKNKNALELRKILNDPKEVGMYLSAEFGKDAPCDHAAEFAAYALEDNGYGSLIGIIGGSQCHYMFMFKKGRKWGAVDDSLFFENGYLEPRFKSVKDLLEYVGEIKSYRGMELYKPNEIERMKSFEELSYFKKTKEDNEKR